MPPNLENDSIATELRARTVEKLWSITEDLNVLYKENWTRLAAREVLEFQENLARGLRRTSYEQVPPLSSRTREHYADKRLHSRRWTFSSSLLYSLTLITTIGSSKFKRKGRLEPNAPVSSECRVSLVSSLPYPLAEVLKYRRATFRFQDTVA